MTIPAAIYGVKSSPDEKESVLDQHKRIREAIEKLGDRQIIGTFGEANKSGYRKERGPQLQAAMRAAINAATDEREAELWVFHSSRLARGDGRKGRRGLGKIVFDLLYENVVVRSVADNEFVTPMLAGIGGTTNNKYSADLSTHVKRGLHQRKEAGGTMGPVPFGYMVVKVRDESGEAVIQKNGKVLTERVPDPDLTEIVMKVFQRIAKGQSPGEVARWLNGLGIRTQRDKPFNALAVRKLVNNDAYQECKGYPRIISDELAEAARKRLKRMDPVAIQARAGGRRPQEDDYILKGNARCVCGAPMYCGRKYMGGIRSYYCKAMVECFGTCKRRPIPAEFAEAHVMRHLDWFLIDIEGWIAERVADRDQEKASRERSLKVELDKLRELDRQREKRLAEIEEHGITSPIALEVIERIDRNRRQQEQVIAQAESVLSEWQASPDVDTALDFYSTVRDLIQGRVKKAKGARELNAALADVLGGMWMSLEGDHLTAEFALLRPVHPEGSFLGHEERAAKRIQFDGWLPSGRLSEPATSPMPSPRRCATWNGTRARRCRSRPGRAMTSCAASCWRPPLSCTTTPTRWPRWAPRSWRATPAGPPARRSTTRS
jgi:DNA invertase Pin-like site-specific DNA recombinase